MNIKSPKYLMSDKISNVYKKNALNYQTKTKKDFNEESNVMNIENQE